MARSPIGGGATSPNLTVDARPSREAGHRPWRLGVLLEPYLYLSPALVLIALVLFVPLILIAWQYRYRAVLIFAIGTSFLDAAFLTPLLQDSSAEASLVGGLLLVRGAIYAFVGYVIIKLIGAQRSHQQELAHAATTREQLATSNERARLARELHDTLAHTLSAVAVQLEGARALWDDDGDRAKAMVDQSLTSTRNGLTEARRAIEALRASHPAPLMIWEAEPAEETRSRLARLGVAVAVVPARGDAAEQDWLTRMRAGAAALERAAP